MSESTALNAPGSPETALAAAFRHIAATRMRAMPLCNPALSVEAIGFRDWRNDRVGVLITPWSMNLICLPGPDSRWQPASSGSPHSLPLPSGDYDFLNAQEDAIGAYLSSSLFSPMFEFADMAQARSVAEAVLAEVFTAVEPAAPAVPAEGMTAKLEQPLSRRGFLGALLPGSARKA
jgi:[NiFe] hydrogenase assembly HybE family chaperone